MEICQSRESFNSNIDMPNEKLVLITGLKGSGKSSILEELCMDILIRRIPIKQEDGYGIRLGGHCYFNFDISEDNRNVWMKYFNNVHGLIFVVDSTNRENIVEAKKELHLMMRNPKFENVYLLIYVHKADISGGMELDEATEKLELRNFDSNRYFIQKSCVRDWNDLYIGFNWLNGSIKGRNL